MPVLSTGIFKNHAYNCNEISDEDAHRYIKRLLNKPDKNDILIPLDYLSEKEIEIKIFNWYIIYPSSLEQFIVCKCKNYENEEIMYIIFDIHNYYLCDRELLESNEILKNIKNNIDIQRNYNTCNNSYICFEDFKIITNEVKTQYYYNFKEDAKINIDNKDLFLLMTPYKISKPHSIYNHNFNQYRWFYVLNKIEPSGSYMINTKYLQHIKTNYNINNYGNIYKTFYCKNASILFSNPINSNKYLPVTRVSIDIECQHFGEFPTPDKFPISHICIDWYKESSIKPVKKIITLTNYEIIENFNGEKNDRFIFSDVEKLMENNNVYINIYCSEKYILHFILYALVKDFDYILTYNGHNFDFKYIQDRRLKNGLTKLKLINAIKIEDMDIKKHSYNQDTTYEIHSNNGIIFLDLYNYTKKFYNLNSYKLGEITKSKFNIIAKIIDNDNEYIVKPIDKNKIKINKFYDVIRTANYCFINNEPYKIKNKKNIIKNNEELYDVESIKNAYNKEFTIFKRDISIKNEIVEVMLSKDDVDIGDKNTYTDYTKYKADDIAYYCVHDTVLCNCIFKYDMIHDRIVAFSNDYLLPHSKAFTYKSSTNMTGVLLKTLIENKTMIISGNVDSEAYDGGLVLKPKEIYIRGPTAVFDFNSEYPSNISEANLSPEKILKIIKLEDDEYALEIVKKYLEENYPYPDYCYILIHDKIKKTNKYILVDRREPGIITKIIRVGMQEKNQNKQLKNNNKDNEILHNYYSSALYSKKIMINSIYGLLGSETFLFKSPAAAEYCTSLGQKCITYIKNLVDNSKYYNNILTFNNQNNPFTNKPIKTIYRGNLNVNFTFRIVYGDTDSLFINIKFDDIYDNNIEMLKKADECFKFLSNIINDIKNEILSKNFEFEYESMFNWLIMPAKKKYIGEIVNNIDPLSVSYTTKGMALVRRDCPVIHKTILQKTIDILKESLINMKDNKNVEIKLNKYVLDVFRDIIENLQYLDINDYIRSVKYSGNYKDPNNNYEVLVKSYNSRNPNDKIDKGQRFSFIYGHVVKEWNIEVKKWNSKYTLDISKHMIILEDYLKNKNKYRICIEKYIKDILTNLEQILDNKNIIENVYNMLINYSPN
ncbi:DNA polymerase [Mythimna separata entomopoxvirus 'L']|uniref:DNA polymerase n=1 Tax=Mythimna separata entomopoxvirus 'L' TaxID=1293572 RepID=A0A916NYA2_9POXV|nr:DNA polymerase [Mythimna separata entomopoxvirus 'L']CCU56273.1 DNA polymerase [Mythimna separata entomopoxvirus 'L']